MLKYLKTDVVFQEIPNEMSLAIAISGCQIRCSNCHSRELWEDKGEPLDVEALCGLLNQNQGVTCCLLLGGEHNIDALTGLFQYAHKRVKTAWYCGLDIIPKDKIGILEYLDFVKTGHYDAELGGLDSPTTNQKLFKKEVTGNEVQWVDITSMLQDKNK